MKGIIFAVAAIAAVSSSAKAAQAPAAIVQRWLNQEFNIHGSTYDGWCPDGSHRFYKPVSVDVVRMPPRETDSMNGIVASYQVTLRARYWKNEGLDWDLLTDGIVARFTAALRRTGQWERNVLMSDADCEIFSKAEN